MFNFKLSHLHLEKRLLLHIWQNKCHFNNGSLHIWTISWLMCFLWCPVGLDQEFYVEASADITKILRCTWSDIACQLAQCHCLSCNKEIHSGKPVWQTLNQLHVQSHCWKTILNLESIQIFFFLNHTIWYRQWFLTEKWFLCEHYIKPDSKGVHIFTKFHIQLERVSCK